MMMVFKTVDTRGLSFFNALNLATKAFKEVKVDGMLELIMDKKKDFTDAFKQWASSKGYKVSDTEADGGLSRLFIKKVSHSKG
ncbi:MAG: sulfurtransferase TusA family protein [Nitrospinales bacterium]